MTTMHFRTLLSVIAVVIGVISFIPYIRSILKGETKPHRTTYGIWAFIGAIELASYVASGARMTALLPLVYLVCEVTVFVLSFKHGMGGTNKLDLICLASAVVGVIGWVITSDSHIALYLGIAASACGFIPTLKKTYQLPHTENASAWGLASVAATFNLLAVPHMELYLISYPLYTFTFDLAEALLTVWPQGWRKSRRTTAPNQATADTFPNV